MSEPVLLDTASGSSSQCHEEAVAFMLPHTSSADAPIWSQGPNRSASLSLDRRTPSLPMNPEGLPASEARSVLAAQTYLRLTLESPSPETQSVLREKAAGSSSVQLLLRMRLRVTELEPQGRKRHAVTGETGLWTWPLLFTSASLGIS